MFDESVINEIKEKESCLNYLEKSKGKLYCCPFCGSGYGANRTGALEYRPKKLDCKCHGCKSKGEPKYKYDVFDLYQYRYGVNFATAVRELAEKHGIKIPPDNARNRQKSDFKKKEYKTLVTEKNATQGEIKQKDFTEYYNICRARMTEPDAAAYLQSRGITQETAAAYWIGYDPQSDPAQSNHPCKRIIIPTTAGHFVARSINPATPKAYKAMNPKGAIPGIFNYKVLYTQEVQTVFITEGAFDALSILQAGAPAIALNSTANADLLINLLSEKPTKATLILCLDNDDTGRKATAALQTKLQSIKAIYTTVDNSFFNGTKDANEALIKDREALQESIMFEQAAAEERRYQEEQKRKQEEEARKRRTGAEMVDNFLQAIQSKKYKPTPTGIKVIDNAIGGGFIKDQVILLGAAPAAGKTAITQWIFETMAGNGQDCLYLNLEMSKDQMLSRSIARIAAQAGEPLKPTEIMQGYKWTEQQHQTVIKAAEEYKEKIAPHLIYNPDTVTPELDSILQYINAEAERATQAPIVIIDYLQLVRGKEREDETQTIKRAMAEFKNFAVKYNTIVFCIMAQNRTANKSGKVIQEAGRDTSALEYGADLQLALVYTECLENDKNKDDLTDEERRRVTLAISKGRWAECYAKANLYFDGATMTFTEIEKERDFPIEWGNPI